MLVLNGTGPSPFSFPVHSDLSIPSQSDMRTILFRALPALLFLGCNVNFVRAQSIGDCGGAEQANFALVNVRPALDHPVLAGRSRTGSDLARQALAEDVPGDASPVERGAQYEELDGVRGA